MSLGSRIQTRGSAAIVASLASTPREPLLFLYPQWMRSLMVKASRSVPTEERKSSTTLAGRTTIPLKVVRNVSNTPETSLSKNDYWNDGSAGFSDHRKIGLGKKELPLMDKHTASGNSGSASRSVKALIAKQPYEPSIVRFLAANDEKRLAKRADKLLRLRDRAETTTISKQLIRREYQEEKRELKQRGMPDWRLVLSDLRKNTPWHGEWLNEAVCLSVPVSASGELFHGIDNNIWEIATDNDCSIAMAPRRAASTHNNFILSGSATAISTTAAEAMRIAPGSILKRGTGPDLLTGYDSLPDAEVSMNESLVRYVVNEPRYGMLASRAEDIKRPSEWTTRSLLEYVEGLTSRDMTNHMNNLLYQGKESHEGTVVEILREIFTDPLCKTALSRKAFHLALEYFVKTHCINDARAVFVLMDMAGVPMSSETFNILLRGAAKKEDLQVFHFVLHLMLKRGFTPNGRTWIAFLMGIDDARIKPHIVVEMKAKGLLANLSTLRRVCEQVVDQEVNFSLDLGQSHDDLLRHMDSRYGKDWLTVDTGNRILYAFAARALISRCWQFLEIMKDRLGRIDNVSVNTILNQCRDQTNIIGAIEVMRKLPSLFQYKPDEIAYHALFEMAWRSRNLNFARVVWKYACLNAATTHKMRSFVVGSLSESIAEKFLPSTWSALWMRQAGLFVTNDTSPLVFRDGDLPLQIRQTKSAKSSRKPLSKADIRRSIRSCIKQECELYKRWTPTSPFGDLLAEAYDKDREWRNHHLEKNVDNIDWKLENAINVVETLARKKIDIYIQA